MVVLTEKDSIYEMRENEDSSVNFHFENIGINVIPWLLIGSF